MSQHSARGASWQALRRAVLERDNFTCVYDGAVATEADHIVPRSKGGEDSMENLVASCKPCNARRQAKTLERATWFNPRHLPDGLW